MVDFGGVDCLPPDIAVSGPGPGGFAVGGLTAGRPPRNEGAVRIIWESPNRKCNPEYFSYFRQRLVIPRVRCRILDALGGVKFSCFLNAPS